MVAGELEPQGVAVELQIQHTGRQGTGKATEDGDDVDALVADHHGGAFGYRLCRHLRKIIILGETDGEGQGARFGLQPADDLRRRLQFSVAAGEPACAGRSEEHTSELQSLMRTSYAGFC